MPNPIVHFEIGCRDRAKAAEFYSGVFDWRVEERDGRAMLRTGTDVGGHLNSLGHEPHNYTLFYVLVEHLAATLTKVSQLGGKRWCLPCPYPEEEGLPGSGIRKATWSESMSTAAPADTQGMNCTCSLHRLHAERWRRV